MKREFTWFAAATTNWRITGASQLCIHGFKPITSTEEPQNLNHTQCKNLPTQQLGFTKLKLADKKTLFFSAFLTISKHWPDRTSPTGCTDILPPAFYRLGNISLESLIMIGT